MREIYREYYEKQVSQLGDDYREIGVVGSSPTLFLLFFAKEDICHGQFGTY